MTPVRELARLHLGSRPASRGGDGSAGVAAGDPMGLRVVTDPAQPAWLVRGGTARSPDSRLDELRVAYAGVAAARASLIDNAEMSLAKTDRFMAAEYLRLGSQPRIADTDPGGV